MVECEACGQSLPPRRLGQGLSAIAVVGPSDLNICFEAQDALARHGAGESNIRVEAAAFAADPGVTPCANIKCRRNMMYEGEVMLCMCGTLTHCATFNTMDWYWVWLINHRPPPKRPSKKLPHWKIEKIIHAMDLSKVWQRADDGIDLETSLSMELDIAKSIVEEEESGSTAEAEKRVLERD